MKDILRSMSFTSRLRQSCWTDVYLAGGARAVSSCGDFLAATALVLELQQRGAGGFAVAAVLIAAAAPPVLLVRWTGPLVDRADSRLLLVATGLAQAAACVALAFTSGPAEIIALVAVLAAGLAVTQPCLSALLPSEAALGFHFCFGTFGGWPAFAPADLGRAVELINASVVAAGRRVDWIHVPTLDRMDDAFAVLDRSLVRRKTDGELLLFTAEMRAAYGETKTAQSLLRAAKDKADGV